MEGEAMLELAEWRRRTAESYAAVRGDSESDPGLAWRGWVARRDEMFRSHAQSPLDQGARQAFRALPYYPYDPAWRFVVEVERLAAEGPSVEALLPEGRLRYRALGAVRFLPPGPAREGRLLLYWLEGYGGGLFLPFGDATNGAAALGEAANTSAASGATTYGGGRYLYDTIKGADLGAGPGRMVLDFNFAYNPSCAYSPQWTCPLAPRENRLPFAVEAGERIESAVGGGAVAGLSTADR